MDAKGESDKRMINTLCIFGGEERETEFFGSTKSKKISPEKNKTKNDEDDGDASIDKF